MASSMASSVAMQSSGGRCTTTALAPFPVHLAPLVFATVRHPRLHFPPQSSIKARLHLMDPTFDQLRFPALATTFYLRILQHIRASCHQVFSGLLFELVDLEDGVHNVVEQELRSGRCRPAIALAPSTARQQPCSRWTQDAHGHSFQPGEAVRHGCVCEAGH